MLVGGPYLYTRNIGNGGDKAGKSPPNRYVPRREIPILAIFGLFGRQGLHSGIHDSHRRRRFLLAILITIARVIGPFDDMLRKPCFANNEQIKPLANYNPGTNPSARRHPHPIQVVCSCNGSTTAVRRSSFCVPTRLIVSRKVH